MNLRECFTHIKANFLAGNAVVLQGPPGFGKTDLMRKVAAWMEQQHPGKRCGVSTFFMATQTPIGFTGLPWRGERTWNGPDGIDHKYTITDPAIPQWYMVTDVKTGEVLPASLFDIVLLIIEEWGQGSAETKRAGAEVLRAGGTPPFYLPAGSYRIALSNVDARDGVTKEFDFIIGRRAELTVTPDVDVWLEDFADHPYDWQGKTWEVMPVTKAWAKGNPAVIFEEKPKKQGPWTNPRTVASADRYAQVMASFNKGIIPANDHGFIEGLRGHLGMAGTQSYASSLQFLLDLPHLEDIVANPTKCPVPTRADLQMLMAYELAGRVKVEHLPEVLTYMSRLPQDLSVTFVSSLLRRDYSILNEPAMEVWTAKNARLVTVITAITKRARAAL